MNRENMADLTAFVTVAQERNFTRAAARLGISQSALSQIIRRLEARLGLRLLSRTTRSVAPTEIGEQLLATLAPMMREIEGSLASLSQFRDRPSGRIRITTVEHAAKTVIVPAIRDLLHENPDITVEVVIDYGLADIVSDRFDAGVRLGADVARDMIAVRISPDIPMSIVGAPSYFQSHAIPLTPQDLLDHRAINLRLPTSDTLNAWRVMQDGQETRVRVEGPLIFNTIDLILDAALDGHGLAYLPSDQVRRYVVAGRLLPVLQDQLPPLPGYHLYYANRRNASPAFRLFVESVRWRGSSRGRK
ncbi:LysR family transcriptional regulator [Paracoccus sp. 11-3]|uniref:LysR family transcriptional regulator n=1 Tax=Paracoccus amoyensis TaxID=2760093 RepID=A0A926JEJ2_9RHOB|nr:LysR family transcriptional regulator [Paracoccus amoyensis]MBC9248303.1 LysR family transcriptional regulator [Paracoccus amoyensis]